MKKLFLYLAICLPVMLLSSCSDDDDNLQQHKDFSTGDCKNVKYNSATLFGYVDLEQLPDVTSYGIVYGKTTTVDPQKWTYVQATEVNANNNYSVSLTNLDSNVGYYYAAYIHQEGKGYSYGEVKRFVTASPTVKTENSSNIGYTEALLSATTSFSLGDMIKYKCGFEISTAMDFSGAKKVETNNMKGGSFTLQLNDCQPATKYYYRAFVGDVKGVAKTFNTLDLTKGEWVDLDLPSHTLWATKNVGANSPTDYGSYFQWGDIKGYTSDVSDGKIFNTSSYKWRSNGLLTKYNYSTPPFQTSDVYFLVNACAPFRRQNNRQ